MRGFDRFLVIGGVVIVFGWTTGCMAVDEGKNAWPMERSDARTLTWPSPRPCAGPIPIFHVDELIQHLQPIPWTYVDAATTDRLPVTDDYEIVTPLILASRDLSKPETCRYPLTCPRGISFRVPFDLPGVTIGSEAFAEKSRSLATLEPGRYRFRFRVVTGGPEVQILSGCGTPCVASAVECPTDRVCYERFDELCKQCLGIEAAVCACQVPEGPREDGAACRYFAHPDIGFDGGCQAGTCRPRL